MLPVYLSRLFKMHSILKIHPPQRGGLGYYCIYTDNQEEIL